MDRRSRGRRKSSHCIQSCLTFSFLRFMADPEKKVDSRKLKVESQRKTKLKKRHNTENTECRGTKSTEGMTIPGIWVGPKNKNAPTVVGAHFSMGISYQSRTWFVKRKMQKEPKRAPARERGALSGTSNGCWHLNEFVCGSA